MVEEFVKEMAQIAYHKVLVNLLLRANVPSVNARYIYQPPDTSPVARKVDERWKAVRTAFNRLCSMHVDTMST